MVAVSLYTTAQTPVLVVGHDSLDMPDFSRTIKYQYQIQRRDTFLHSQYDSLMECLYHWTYDSTYQVELLNVDSAAILNTNTVIHKNIVYPEYISNQGFCIEYQYDGTHIFEMKLEGRLLAINELSAPDKKITMVRYYTLTGQLIGTYTQKQNNLPKIPLIEEIIYNDNEVSTRELIRL